ncbi:hypothetical protein PP175_26495 (plasmid) [Aneurinibacillus sp. Ricciae_BoGa-3]|uniref:hypothetical protein n=1 Tax=Aneurinibacillus sp. Ricciae_BoGa-3 TaxID=3022697 RepID=UPI0023413852|nr:hypothetical protein [Aneurinibacillus sp. Ricciae_BoGa-3]WCK57615.1 hypothetical protein PP175_26495 [Aneurinibacillus sp. Ricciae_BoGa-3]
MNTLVLSLRKKEIHFDVKGNVQDGEVVGKVHWFRVVRDNDYFYMKEKHYATLKEAFKALYSKVKQYPNTTYFLYMNYEDKVIGTECTTRLFNVHMCQNGKVTIDFGYDQDFFCSLHPRQSTIIFEDDRNEGNTFLLDWFPKKRNVKPTPLQAQIQSFREFNVMDIKLNGQVKDEQKARVFSDLMFCLKNINKIFTMTEFFAIREIFFSKYKTAKGKYGAKPLAISLNPHYHANRDSTYHEYGHLLFDAGQEGIYRYTNSYGCPRVDRTKAIDKMNDILSLLYEETTITEIKKRAEWKSNRSKSKVKCKKVAKYEEYLLQPTEVFARLFEATLLFYDQQRGENLDYKLDFTEEEIKKAEPLLKEYLSLIRADYQEDIRLGTPVV